MPESPFAVFSPQFTWRQATWAAAVAVTGYLPNDPVKDVYKASPYFCADVSWSTPATDLQVKMAFVDTGKTMWIGLEGTTNITQGLAFILRDGIVHPWNDLRGVFRIFWETAQSCLIDIKAKITRQTPVVITGHSLGGAAAMIVADVLKRDGYDIRGVVTFGQPYTGNERFVAEFTVQMDRVFHWNDIVPRFPSHGNAATTYASLLLPIVTGGGLTIPRQLVHGGMPRELDEPGADDNEALFLERLRLLGTKLTIGQAFDHLMGQYVGLCFEKLGPAGKQLFLPLTQSLLRTESFKLINTAFPAADPDTLAINFEQVKTEERAFAQTLLGPTSKVKLRLYKQPFVDPPPAEIFVPDEADFPGYAPIVPSSDVPITGGGLTACKIGPAKVTWTASAGPFPAHVVGGIYVTYVFADGVERNVKLIPFPEAITVSEENQQITVEVEAALARFSD